MTDEEIRQYVDGKIGELTDSMIDVASLPQAQPDSGTSLPFVKQERLVSAPVSELGGGGGDDEALSIEDIDEVCQ